LASDSLAVADLVTHRFPAEEGEDAYDTLRDDAGALAILLEFGPESREAGPVHVAPRSPRAGALRVGVIGAGAFARGTLVPALVAAGDVELAAVCSRSGASARSLAERFEIPVAGTDWRALVDGGDVDAVVVATPHAEHAEMAAAALAADKAVLVEKPLALDVEGLARVAAPPGPPPLGHHPRLPPLAQPPPPPPPPP